MSVIGINMTLTNYAQGFSQDNASALADFIAPEVRTGAASGQYKQFSDKNAFQVYNTARAIGGSRTRIEFLASDEFFKARPQGLAIAIDDEERNQVGDVEGAQLGLEEAKVTALVSTALTSREVSVFNSVKAAKPANAGVGVWSDATVDPIAEIDAEIVAIYEATGIMPNRMVIGFGAWAVLRNHAKVKERLSGIDPVLTLQKLKDILINPEIDIRLGTMTRDINKFGKGKSAQNIVGGEIFTFIGSDNPTAFDPSFAKTFTTKKGGVDSVKVYRSEDNVSDMVAVDWSEDVKVVAPIAGSRITLS